MAKRDSNEPQTRSRSAFRRPLTIGLVVLIAAGLGVAALAIETSREGHDAAGRLKTSHVLHGHKGGVLGLAFSPDGRTLAAAAVAGGVRLWDASSWRLVGELPGHSILADLAFSPDGRTLVTAGQDGSVKLWDVQRRSLVGQLRGHRGWVLDVAFSDDGSTLATAGDHYYGDGTIRLWDARRLKALSTSTGADAVAMWFSKSGRTLTFLNAVGQVKSYDVLHDQAPRVPWFDTGSTEYGNGEASPDRSKLVLVNEDGRLLLWDVLRRPPRDLPLRVHTYQSWSGDPVAFAPDGRTFASVSSYTASPRKAGTIVLWDVARRAPRGKTLTFHNRGVTGMAFSLDGHTLAAGGVDGTVRLRKLASPPT